MYAGIGQSLGSLIGGSLCKQYGISTAFQYCALLDFAMLAAFICYQIFQKWKGEGPTTVQFEDLADQELVKPINKTKLPLILWNQEKGFESFFKQFVVFVNTLYDDCLNKILHLRHSIKFRKYFYER